MNAGNDPAHYSEQRDMTQPWRPPPPMPPARPRRGGGFIIGMIAAGIGGVLVLSFLAVACIAIITPSTNSTPGAVGPQASAPAQQQTGPVASFGDGTYRVGPGHDIMPGQYRTNGSGQAGVLDSCYWERNVNDSGQLEAIVSNDNFNGPASITVRSGEYLKVSGGCLWTKTG